MNRFIFSRLVVSSFAWILLSIVTFADGPWITIDSIPGERYALAAATLGNSVYAIGGGYGTAYAESSVYRYNGTSWASVASLPAARCFLAAATLGSNIYAIGGYDNTYGSHTYSNVYRFDGTVWTEVASLPKARYDLAAATLGGYIYAIGGWVGASGALTNVYRFDGTAWTEVAGLPTNIYGFAAASLGNYIYVIGGACGVNPITNVYRFDGTAWTEVAGLPNRQYRMAACGSMGGYIYSIGGYINGDYTAKNVYRFDGTVWTEVDDLPIGRYCLAATSLGNKIFAIGGSRYNEGDISEVDQYAEGSAGTLQFSASSANINEDAGSVSLTVTRSGGSSGTAMVNYTTQNGTAIASTDYTATSGQLNWADGSSDSQTITVPIINRAGTQGGRAFIVTLSDASGASLGSIYQVTVTINDASPSVLSASISLLSGFGELYINNPISLYANVSGAQGTASCQWDLNGDGSFGDASGQQVSYQYSTEGTRLVEVRVNDGYQSATASLFVTIGKAPQPNEPTPPPALDPKSGDGRDPLNGDNSFTDWSKKENGLIIIAHGMNAAATNDWIKTMATAIATRLGSNYCPNIIAWDWRERARQPNNPVGWVRARIQGIEQGEQLAEWINTNANAGNIKSERPIHIIGHSAGGFVAGNCASIKPIYIDQITLLDTPVPNSNIERKYLSSDSGGKADFYLSYYGTTPLTWATLYPNLVHYLHLPSSYQTHEGAHEWYTVVTISDSTHDGFWYSPWVANEFPFTHGINETSYNTTDIEQNYMSIDGFTIFGNVTYSDDVYTITEGSGNAGIYKTVTFPLGSQNLFFKYKFIAPSDGDFLSVHIGTNEPYYVGANLGVSRENDVDGEACITNIAGQIDQLVFKLISRGSPNAQIQIHSIQIESDYSTLVADFDGDLKTDPVIYQAGDWKLLLSGAGYISVSLYFGGIDYEPITGDYDGDGKADYAVIYQGVYYIYTAKAQFFSMDFGLPNATPISGDFDGDRKTDCSLYHEDPGTWYVQLLNSGQMATLANFGGPGWNAVVGDFDGDSKADPAVYQEATGAWKVLLSGSSYTLVSTVFGGNGFEPVAADFDGDSKADPAIYQESTGIWKVLLSGSSYALASAFFGGLGHVPVAGDFDGDGKADLVVYHESTGMWNAMLSGNSYSLVSAIFGGLGYKALHY